MHATLSDVIADTAQNSIEAGAKKIEVSLIEDGATISVRIKDNGKGMDASTRERAFDPFYTEPGKHDKRKVGLGLPILKQLCESTGGSVSLASALGQGTLLEYSFAAKHIVLMLFNYPGEFDLVFSHKKGETDYSISRSELADAVGGFETPEGLSLAREFLTSQENG